MARMKKGKARHPTKGKGLLAAVDIVLENTMMQNYDKDLTKREIAQLCERYLPNDWINRVIDQALPNAIGDRLRQAKICDCHGNDVRRFGSYKVAFQTDDGKERVYDCWKAWKHMDDDQQLQALQAQINRAANNVIAVQNLVRYVNNEVRKPGGRPPLRLRWTQLKAVAV